ncbi:MAG TPA: DUF4293 family protein [Chitinophagaceae bacterium]|nr:DUF4293 family protein [Chitinophagaceae bacterium]
MLLRIQTLYFLLAAACAALLWWLDFREIPNLASFLIQSLLVLIGLVGIFLHRNKPFQRRMAITGGLLSIVVLVLEYFTIRKLGATHATIQTYHYLSPLVCLFMGLFFFLAARAVRKDIRLLKSSERLR